MAVEDRNGECGMVMRELQFSLSSACRNIAAIELSGKAVKPILGLSA